MIHVCHESKSTRTALRIDRDVYISNLSKLAEHSEQRVTSYLEVNVVNEDLCECPQVLVTSRVWRLLFGDCIAQGRQFLLRVSNHVLATLGVGCATLSHLRGLVPVAVAIPGRNIASLLGMSVVIPLSVWR